MQVNGEPKGLDYFDISSFPELVEVYGDRPSRIVLRMPSSDPVNCYDSDFIAWGKNRTTGESIVKRVCNGEECMHRIDGEFGAVSFVAGEVSGCICKDPGMKVPERQRCKFSAILKAYVVHPSTREPILAPNGMPSLYPFRTRSIHSGSAVYSELYRVFAFTMAVDGVSRLTEAFFEISVKLVPRRDNNNRKFPIWTFSTLQLARAGGNQIALPSASMHDEGDVEIIESTDPELLPDRGARSATARQADRDPAVDDHQGMTLSTRINKLGSDVYGLMWPATRPTLIQNCTRNRVMDLGRATEDELELILSELLTAKRLADQSKK
jgi:hypothetical protein